MVLKRGISQADWDASKEEARAIMIDRTKVRGMITYTDLVKQIKRVRLEPHDPRLFHLLGEISTEEDAAGRGMLSVIVVHKTGDMEPGLGFFELANILKRNTANPMNCWVDELHKVHKVWSELKR